jgi:integration host factor subunit beta
MTKSDLIDTFAKKLQIPKARAEQIINQIFDSMTDAMKRREGIEIRGFGSFAIREYKAYSGRNPRTGENVEVAPKRLPFFKVGKALKEMVDAPNKRADDATTKSKTNE